MKRLIIKGASPAAFESLRNKLPHMGLREIAMEGGMILEGESLADRQAEVAELLPGAHLIPSDGRSQDYRLKQLDCANCAAKMEREISDLPGVGQAKLDFLAKRLTLEPAQGVSFQELEGPARKIIHRLEPEVEMTAWEKVEEEAPLIPKKDILRLGLGLILFLVGILGKFNHPLDLIIFLAAYLIAGYEVLVQAVKGVVGGNLFNENFLMAIATIGAFFIGEYPEGVAVMLFYLVGELFQDLAVGRSQKSITSLLDLRPDYANVPDGDGLRKVAPDSLAVGDIIVVRPGEKIPLDGRVIQGDSMVDTAALTGESVPRHLRAGEEALSGFINQSGLLEIRVEKTFANSTVSQILDLVQNASANKAPTEKFITKFARYYTPAVVFGALALALIPPLFIPGATFSQWIYRALVFLVISCPCALVLSIPLGFFGGIGGASKKGILVKGSNYLEALNQVDCVVFDKTGTLTKGSFQVTTILPQGRLSAEDLLEAAAHAEIHSSHPIAQSIRAAYGKTPSAEVIENYEEIAGHGIKASYKGQRILAGNEKLLADHGIAVPEMEAVGSLVHLALGSDYAGSIQISDEVKGDAKKAIADLKARGIKTIMLTGDRKETAAAIGQNLGIDEVRAELLPQDKVAALEAIKEGSRRVVFVGDGINDAPVLARADIGMAMGALGSDAAIEAADVVLMKDEPSAVSTAIAVAGRTRRIVLETIAFALGVKIIFLILGAMGMTSMWGAVFADTGVAILAILNAMRAMKTKDL